jgi:hypothetical protein
MASRERLCDGRDAAIEPPEAIAGKGASGSVTGGTLTIQRRSCRLSISAGASFMARRKAAKAIVADYYKKAPAHLYFSGCSDADLVAKVGSAAADDA